MAALREIALRRAADRLTRASAATVPHAAGGEDVLVLVTADAAAPRVIRAAAGMAEAFGGSCTALVVESGGEGRSKGDAALARSITLAEEMGAHIVTLTGDDPVQAVYNLKDYIVHTHAKDGRRNYYRAPEEVYGLVEAEMLASPSFTELPLGTGNVDFAAYLKALDEIGYHGFLTVEREVGDTPEKDIQTAVEFLQKLIH